MLDRLIASTDLGSTRISELWTGVVGGGVISVCLCAVGATSLIIVLAGGISVAGLAGGTSSAELLEDTSMAGLVRVGSGLAETESSLIADIACLEDRKGVVAVLYGRLFVGSCDELKRVVVWKRESRSS